MFIFKLEGQWKVKKEGGLAGLDKRCQKRITDDEKKQASAAGTIMLIDEVEKKKKSANG